MNKTTKTRHARGFTLVELLVVIAIIAALAGLALPAILGTRKRAAATECTSNMKQVGLLLFQFSQDYGSYPSKTLAEENSRIFKNVSTGDSANALLGQLIASKLTKSEEIFYAKGGSPTKKKPDNVINSPAKLLQPGECGFGYVMFTGDEALGPDSNTGLPVLVAPLESNSGGSSPKLNDEPYGGKAVYLRVDQSVRQDPIDEDTGEILIPGNLSLFERGEDTVWDDKTADVKAPD